MGSADLKDRALKLLQQNTRTATYQGTVFTYTVPSPASYPFQWLWDSCFHAIVWTHFDPERAKEEMRSLLSWQDKSGFLPHVIFWDQKKAATRWWHIVESKDPIMIPFLPVTFLKPKTTGETQPPLVAQAVLRIFEATHDTAFVRETLPKLDAYYRWLLTARDPDHDGLISIISPYESGLDWSSAYDPAFGFHTPPRFPWYELRAMQMTLTNKFFYNYDSKKILAHGLFNVEDVLMNSILALNLAMLSELHRIVGEAVLAQEFWTESRRVSDALLAKCWDKERSLFFNLSGRDEKRYPIAAIQSLMPLIIPWLPHKIGQQVVERHVRSKSEFWTRYPLPSVAMSEPTFSERSEIAGGHVRIWRGTTWVNTNWYLAPALRRLGYSDLADELVAATQSLIRENGFREHFNPRTGEGYGAYDFGWSTLVIDM